MGLLTAFCAFGSAWAASPSATSQTPNYITRILQTDAGLPQSSVTAVTQTQDDYLWLGTRSGLARFDGVRFTAFDSANTPALHSPHVTSLFEDEKGRLWIGHETGEVTCYEAGAFRNVPFHAAWRGGKIFGIGADTAGDIWLLNYLGELARIRDGAVISAPSDKVVHLIALARRPDGGMWIQRDSEVSFLADGELHPVVFDAGITNQYIQGIGQSRTGGLWVMMNGRMQKWRDGEWIDDLGPAPWGEAPVHTLIEMRDGSLAAATADHGVFMVFPGTGAAQFCRTNGLSDDWVTSLHEDGEGNLWAGTGNGGLAVLRASSITTLSPPDRWQGRMVLSVSPGLDGALWVGTEGAGLYRFRDGNWTNFGADAGLAHRYIWSVTLDATGKIWAGTWGGGLLVQKRGPFELPDELAELTAPVPALFALPDGGLLVGTGIGLLQYDQGKVSWLARKPEVISPDVRAVVQAPDGTVWFGMFGGGLGRIQNGMLTQFRRRDGLSSDFVQCLRLNEDGALWIGTFGGGLNRFKDGRFTIVTRRQGLQNDVICHIEDDGLGYLWMSSHGGIMRISKTELDEYAAGRAGQVHCLAYGLSDGLPTLESSGGFQPAGCRTPDGRLWFPTRKGLVAVDPAQVRTHLPPPRVIIEKLLVNDHLIAEHPVPSQLEIAPGRHRFEFAFTALSFTAPEKVRFRYRLEGLETGWVETQAPRQAYYSHIPPGRYQFVVHACNNDGVWNNTGATLAFAVLPAFWQTWWFRTLGAVLTAVTGGGIVWLDARRRMRRKLEDLERQQAIERERARIARDIHDDLGAGLTRISLLSESVPPEQIRPPQAAEALERIFGTTRDITQAMDEIVWAVNPQHDSLDSLASYLGKYAQDFLESAGVRCRLDMPMQLPKWRIDAEVRHNLFLAFKEVLNNVLRHARASEVRVSLTTRPGQFSIVVEDDGHGFAEPLNGNGTQVGRRCSGRNGLGNLQKRLQQIGGECVILSAPDRGTRIEFTIPAGSQPA